MSWHFEAAVKGSHVHVKVRSGPTPGRRPLLGKLIMTPTEWNELRSLVTHGSSCGVPVDWSEVDKRNGGSLFARFDERAY